MREHSVCLNSKILIADDFADLSFHVGTYSQQNTLWICDTNTARMVRPLPEPNVILQPGESAKSWASVERILSTAMDNNIGRDGLFVALGGGVVSDITAFAASIYKRGVKLVIIPTTLLSMVDASIGGKCGIDFQNAKNIVGAYHPASEILICTDCLRSLPQKEFINGLSEIIKHGLLAKDSEIYDILNLETLKILNHDPDIIHRLVELSIKVKRDFVLRDPYEKNGIRQALNLGHTFGHALESISRLQISHGEAVAWGCCKALEISADLGLCDPSLTANIERLYSCYGYDIGLRIDRSDWVSYKMFISKDKKRTNDTNNFVLLRGIGDYVLQDVDDEILKKYVLQPTGPVA